MGRYLEQTESRSELQQRIAADLRARAAAQAKQGDRPDHKDYHDAPDGVIDAAYMKGTKATTTLAPAWVIIGLAAVGVFIYFIYQVSH